MLRNNTLALISMSLLGLTFLCISSTSQAANPGYWVTYRVCEWYEETNSDVTVIWCDTIGDDPFKLTEDACRMMFSMDTQCTKIDYAHFPSPYVFSILNYGSDEIVASYRFCEKGKEFDSISQQCVHSTEPDVGEDCSNESNHGNPINILQGNKFHRETDYIGHGSYPLKFTRYYNSNSGRWTYQPLFNLNGEEVVIQKATGKHLHYFNYIEDQWVGMPLTRNKLESVADAMGVRTGWRHHLFSTGEIEEYDLQGSLIKSTSRQGATHTFSYASNKITISSSEGDSIALNFGSNSELLSLVDSDSNQTSYAYNSNGLISSVTFPGGMAKQYHYENPNFPTALTGITDENGDRYATWEYDDQGRAAGSEHALGAEKILIDYSYKDDLLDPRISITNALGKQTTYHIATNGSNLRFISRVEGHPSPNCVGANQVFADDGSGNIYKKTDPKGTITSYRYDGLNREIKRIEAQGTSKERTITTEWHPTFNLPAKITEPGRETVIAYDASGNELSRTVTEITP